MKIAKTENGCILINQTLQHRIINGPEMEYELQYIFYKRDGVWVIDVIECADLKIVKFNGKGYDEDYNTQRDLREKFKAVGFDLDKDIDDYIKKQEETIKPIPFLKQYGIIVSDKPIKKK